MRERIDHRIYSQPYRTPNGPGVFYVKARRRKLWHLGSVTDTLRLVVVPQMFLVYSPASKEHHMVDQCFISFGYQRFNLKSLKFKVLTYQMACKLFFIINSKYSTLNNLSENLMSWAHVLKLNIY